MSAAPWINDKRVAAPSARRRRGRTRGTVATEPRTSRIATAIKHLAGFTALTMASYGLLSLGGHSMLSAATKARENAELRTESARMDVLEFGRQVSGLASSESLDRWADTHGFVRTGALVATNHVAKNASTDF